MLVLDALFGVGPPPSLSSRRHAIVQGDHSSRDALVVRSWCSMPSLASDRRRRCVLSPSTHWTFVPLSPSCREIVQVETRSLCVHAGSRCPLWRRTAAVAVCSRRPHRTFVPLSQSCRAGSFKSRRDRCALMVLDALLWRRAAAVAVCSRRPHWTFIPFSPSCRAIETRSLCVHGSRCPLWRRTTAALSSRRPAIVQKAGSFKSRRA